MTSIPLRNQQPTLASPRTKIRLTILATALVDALGAPGEFHRRFSYDFITTMIPNTNFHLPKGVWTDDTSMTLCLARSIATYSTHSQSTPKKSVIGGFDQKDQLEAYLNWYGNGQLSATGACFDIGNTIQRALTIYAETVQTDSSTGASAALKRIGKELGGERSCGNGSLMRVVPIGLAYWRDPKAALRYARMSSETTHPNEMCVEACEVWTGLVVRVMQASTQEVGGAGVEVKPLTKLNLLDYLAKFQYSNAKLREALAVPPSAPGPCPEEAAQREEYYRTYHPILRLVKQLEEEKGTGDFAYHLPTEKQLPSSGYVLHSVVAALYCFFATTTFEGGAIMAANLGNDADTVGAIYGGLAGCWYAGEERRAEGAFWSNTVRGWRKALVKRELLYEVAKELADFSEIVGDPTVSASKPAFYVTN